MSQRSQHVLYFREKGPWSDLGHGKQKEYRNLGHLEQSFKQGGWFVPKICDFGLKDESVIRNGKGSLTLVLIQTLNQLLLHDYNQRIKTV